LYVRKSDTVVTFGSVSWTCTGVLQIGNIEAEVPGNGAFVELLRTLKDRKLAVFVECVHNRRFRRRLLELGFVQVNADTGFHYLWNYEGHLRHPHGMSYVQPPLG